MSEIFQIDKSVCEHIAKENCRNVTALLKKADLPTAIPAYIDREYLVKKLYTDKKVKNGQLRFVIQNGIGNIAAFNEGVYATKIEEDIAREIIFNM
ncbi:MAG: hypothetical protein HDQ99_11775 [Lachnospiraceae bacterium]|nr:hypothetical protein [Lachnospiraceae bacterium]